MDTYSIPKNKNGTNIDKRNFLYRIIASDNSHLSVRMIQFFLWLLSCFYQIAVRFCHWLYQIHLLPTTHLTQPVICVGNITVGGTGKTPVVKHLANFFQGKGYKVAILSRGYHKPKGGNTSSGMLVVSNFERLLSTWETAGDEPYLLARELPGVAVIVGKNRKKTGDYAIQKLGANLIIMDDGFSHFGLHRDLNLLLLDATNPFGYGYCLPRGLLREPLKNIIRADILLLTRMAQENPSLLQELSLMAPQTPIFRSQFVVKGIKRFADENFFQTSDLNSRKILAVSGIGNPESFHRILLDNFQFGQLVEIQFPDHHPYSPEDIKYIHNLSLGLQSDYIVTTAKDAVKVADLLQEKDHSKWAILEIEIQINKESALFETLEKKVKSLQNMI